MTIKNVADIYPSQDIIIASVIQSDTVPYAFVDCIDSNGMDTTVCVVSFLLTEEFYKYDTMTLTGFGTLLLEFGDSIGGRKLGNRKVEENKMLQTFTVTPAEFDSKMARQDEIRVAEHECDKCSRCLGHLCGLLCWPFKEQCQPIYYMYAHPFGRD